MKEKMLLVMGSVSVAVFLLLFSQVLTLNFFTLTDEQEHTLQFLEGKEELKLNYTAAEQAHLEDVKRVMKGAEIILYLSGMAVLFMVIYFWKNKPLRWKLLRYGGLVTVIFVAVLLLAVLVNFNSLFALFHQLFFPQGNWQFHANSLLIQTFPQEFFVKAGGAIFAMAGVLGIALYALGRNAVRRMMGTPGKIA